MSNSTKLESHLLKKMYVLNPIQNYIEKLPKIEGAILVRGRLCIVDRGDSISMGETLYRYRVSGGDSVSARGDSVSGGDFIS